MSHILKNFIASFPSIKWSRPQIDNSIYDKYGEKWYTEKSDPVAILRQESKLKNQYLRSIFDKKFGNKKLKILDLGCGGGLLSNELAKDGHQIIGLDISKGSLEVAKKYDSTQSVQYIHGSAYKTEFADETFDVVLSMDMLEHVEDPEKVIAEAARLTKKGGLFFYHTFNRNFLSYFIIIKLTEWICPGITKNIHVYHLFIKPRELFNFCSKNKLVNVETKGVAPCLFSFAALKSIVTQKVCQNFKFKLIPNWMIGYLGYAQKH